MALQVRRGRFITFEGPEGSGKSTQVRLLRERLEALGRAVVQTREPGGTALGKAVRELLFGAEQLHLVPETEALLLSADRAQHVAEVIRPALAAGQIVLSDRHVDSMIAYQGYGAGMDLARLAELAAIATGGLAPDLTVLIDLDPTVSLARRHASSSGGGEVNRFDRRALAFHERVREGFLTLAAREPDRFVVIDGLGPVEAVAEAIWSAIQPVLSGHYAGRVRSAAQLAFPDSEQWAAVTAVN
jgi:dTMP kinase